MTIWALDFDNRKLRNVPITDLTAKLERHFCWLDLRNEDLSDPEAIAKATGLSSELFARNKGTNELSFAEDHLRFTVDDPNFLDGKLISHPVRVIVAKGFLVTIDHADAEFMRNVRQTFKDDSKHNAESPGFLLFELADHLDRSFRVTARKLNADMEAMELSLFENSADSIFADAADLTRRSAELRKAVLSAHDIVDELACRHSPYIPESTRPFLQRKAEQMDRLAAELTQERDALSASLQLYLGMVGMKNNRALNRLTAFSVTFLPLGFLTGVFGMNFVHIPGLEWDKAFTAFWGGVAGILIVLAIILRRSRD